MPNVISITDKINHLTCLSNLGWDKVDVLTVGDPQNYLLSPCCIHGYRLIWSPRPMMHWFRPTVADLTGLPGTGGKWSDHIAAHGEAGAAPGADIDTLGVGTWAQLNDSWIDTWHTRNNILEHLWNWSQETPREGQGGDRPDWFTPGVTIKGVGGAGTSWVLVDNFDAGTGTGPANPPAGIQSKWWATTQTDLSTVEEELNAQSGFDYVEGQQRNIVGTTSAGNENSGLGVTTALGGGSMVGGLDPLWILYGQRTYIGITKCNDVSPHTHPGTSNWNGVGHFDADIFKDITAGPSHEGGMTPEIILYGGDVHGVRAQPTILADGTIDGFEITDPGATVIGLDVIDSVGAQGLNDGSEIAPPNITLSTPSSYYSGFAAEVDVSSIFEEMKAANPDFFKTSAEVYAEVVDSYIDPIAQTFMVNESYESGIFLHSVDICFSDRPVWGESTGVTLEIRPTINGVPSAEHIMLSRTIEDPTEVNVADGNSSTALRTWDNPNDQTVVGEILPNFNGEWGVDNVAYTRFLLPYPLYLESATEYCFVVRSNDSNYKVWLSDTRLPILTTGMIAKYDSEDYEDIKPETGRKQYGGSFFRSQNGRTWSPDQNLDIMFRLNKCVFPTNQPKTAIFRASGGETGTDVVYDRIKLDVNSILVPSILGQETTVLSGSLSTYTDASGGVTEVDAGIINQTHEEETRDLSERMKILPLQPVGSGSIKATYELETVNRDVSPQIDTRNIFVTPVKNEIDNGALSVSDIVVVNGGIGYTTASKFTVSPGGGQFGTTNATFEVSAAPNNIIDRDVGIIITGGTTSGSGFHRAVANTTIHQIAGPGSGADFRIDSEEGKGAGNSKVRYVTQIINLAPGMEARHLRSFMSAHKPEGSSIYVYHKVLSAEDTEEMSDKKWTLMTQSSPDSDSFNIINVDGVNKYSEFEFNSNEIITYAADDESVAIPPTYDTFKSFQIKIVLFAKDPTKVPLVKQFRTIAVY